MVALLVGVFLDLDHLLDYYQWLIRNRSNRLWLFLHSYELVIPAVFISYILNWNPLAIAGTLALLGHILSDQWAHRVRSLSYFFTYRALNGFRPLSTTPSTPREMYQELVDYPLMSRIVPPIIALLKKLSHR